jgi:prepilin-type N-terminal cleavage/methylation domain-containing protein
MPSTPRPAREAGFTLIETMVAVLVLTIALLGLGRFVSDFMQGTTQSTIETVAVNVAREQIEAVRSDPVYAALETRYAGETGGIPGYAGMRRTTTFRHVGPPAVTDQNYKTVTVVVTDPALRRPVTMTLSIAAP